MKKTNFGIEIEMTGITRESAAKETAKLLNGSVKYTCDSYRTYEVKADDGKVWKFMSDASINTMKRNGGPSNNEYSVEMVSPILTYEKDIETLQNIVRNLRGIGAMVNSSCGIHIHLDGAKHNARTIKNFINIIYARNDLFYKALGVNEERKRYCKRMDEKLVKRTKTATTLKEIENIWYEEYGGSELREKHYNQSRYHFLNLHSFFHGHKTVELRGFNGTLHAGEIRSYIAFALAINEQALKQKCASCVKPQVQNEKFAMRIYLNRIGLIGDEFKAVRKHLTKLLKGCSAWRFREAA